VIVVLYILIFLVAILAAVSIAIAAAPVKLHGDLSRNSYNIRADYLGFWFKQDNNGRKTGFLWKRFEKKAKSEELSPKKSKKKKKDEPSNGKKSETHGEKKKPGALFWFKRRQILQNSAFVVLRMVFEIPRSLRFRITKLFFLIGDGDPAISGSIYGWVAALETSFPKSVPLDVKFDFNPLVEWNFRLKFEVRDCIFRAVIAPVARAIWRLPKWKILKLYRDYRRFLKVNNPKPAKQKPVISEPEPA